MDKAKGIKGFLARLEIKFVREQIPAEIDDTGIEYDLAGFGGVYTPGYDLFVKTSENDYGRSFCVFENDRYVANGLMRDFNAGKVFEKLTYNKEC